MTEYLTYSAERALKTVAQTAGSYYCFAGCGHP